MEAPVSSRLDMPGRCVIPTSMLLSSESNRCFQNFPDHQYPSVVGRPILRTEEQAPGDITLKDIMCGDEAAAARSMLQITYPVR
jgi:hypothetical protein